MITQKIKAILRTSHIDLPASDEIMRISNAEEKRKLLPEKLKVHYPDFRVIKTIYKYYDIDTSIFDIPDLIPQHILKVGSENVNKLVTAILGKTLSSQEIAMFHEAHDYLSEEDTPQKSDYIFVFGAKTPFRIQKAIELYSAGLAPKIIISGRGPLYSGFKNETETEQYGKIATDSGVPKRDLILEDSSITMPDNVRRTLNMMDATSMAYRSFIIVNSPYCQLRGWCSWKKHTSDNVILYRVNSETGEKFMRESWFLNEDGLRVVFGEFIKLRNTIAFNDA